MIARQHPQCAGGIVFVTIEDQTGDVQAILRPQVFAQYCRALSNPLISTHGRIDRWDATTNIVAVRISIVGVDIHIPDAQACY